MQLNKNSKLLWSVPFLLLLFFFFSFFNIDPVLLLTAVPLFPKRTELNFLKPFQCD